jgi:hypothetical protein
MYSIVLHLPIDCHHKLGPTVWAKQELELENFNLNKIIKGKGTLVDVQGTVLYYIFL